jgi:pimeloyl-ACP methyl ester carboxylesterase
MNRPVRSGQQAALGKDVVALLDALDIRRAMLVGYDWGGLPACLAAESPDQERQYWYQWYFQLERGGAGLESNRQEICKLLRKLWSATWAFDDKLFSKTAKSFDKSRLRGDGDSVLPPSLCQRSRRPRSRASRRSMLQLSCWTARWIP